MAHPPNLVSGTFRLNRTLVMVGLMGAGKTSVGRRLARALDVRFVDSDHEIETAANMSISEIFDKFGEEYFRQGEERVISRLLDGEPCVLATGGGAFMSDAVRQRVSERGVSIWLKADTGTLFNRVKSKADRPLLREDNPRTVLENLQELRGPVYRQADVVVESFAGISQWEMVARIIEAVENADESRPEGEKILCRLVP
ncbi:MAG: shikimate kinase [Paracoccaceae bacterium]